MIESSTVAPQSENRSSIWGLATSLFLITAAVNLQAPLYAEYAHAGHFGPEAQTIAFACYVAGLVPTLTFLSGLSDRLGRKLPLMIAIMLAAVATSFPIIWPGLEAVAAARMLCGAATGLMASAGTAFMAELMNGHSKPPEAAARIVAAATSLGFGSGALATSLYLLAFPGTLLPATYGGYIVLACCGLIWMSVIHERVRVRSTV
ncbi:MFS transporter [Nguyenibacter sp. L1]|uniref:MFS transporter n=1 Tax=Nguyenibacter sp. L1 TaxID=3049350 RepID=UPI002B473259|nr:MFS transporter [Nguyenibacter sp. L1]WRH89802.1 MFS transporter [Nguyenibacter sp. L1]